MAKSADSVVPKTGFIPKELFDKIQKTMPIPCVDLVILRRGKIGIRFYLLSGNLRPSMGNGALLADGF